MPLPTEQITKCAVLSSQSFVAFLFQPYAPGQSPEVLKWKPHTLNSVDFVLNIRTVKQEG